MGDRRTACILITAAAGYRRAARGLVSRALRESLGIQNMRSEPHFAVYYREGFDDPDFAARYIVSVTDDEFHSFEAKVEAMAKNEGWETAPIDCYHD